VPAPRPPRRPGLTRAAAAKKYTEQHELVAFDDATGLGTVHITHYAQRSLGDVVFVELPAQGAVLAQGGACACWAAGVRG
jgi:glycine cleavage system H protein